MSPQLFKRPMNQRHADELTAALALPEHFDGDRIDSPRVL
jgi:hypothetical protein